MRTTLWIVLAAILFFFGGYRIGIRRVPDPVILHRVDTVTRTVVQPQQVTQIRYVRDTLYTRDTVEVEVLVPIRKYVFSDSLYRAEVSGYGVTLDRIDIYRPTVTITERVKVPRRWGIGLSAGYGVSKAGLSPYIGIGINYNIICF